MTIIEERKRQMEQKIIERIIKGRQTKKEHQKEQNIYDFFNIFNDGINDPETNIYNFFQQIYDIQEEPTIIEYKN